jgi:hypothetical protein
MMTDKDFDCVKMMRDICNKISIEVMNLNPDQIKEYFRKKSEEYEAKYGQAVHSDQTT